MPPYPLSWLSTSNVNKILENLTVVTDQIIHTSMIGQYDPLLLTVLPKLHFIGNRVIFLFLYFFIIVSSACDILRVAFARGIKGAQKWLILPCDILYWRKLRYVQKQHKIGKSIWKYFCWFEGDSVPSCLCCVSF